MATTKADNDRITKLKRRAAFLVNPVMPVDSKQDNYWEYKLYLVDKLDEKQLVELINKKELGL